MKRSSDRALRAARTLAVASAIIAVDAGAEPLAAQPAQVDAGIASYVTASGISGNVNSIGSDYTAYEASGVIMVTAQLEPPNLARAEAEILREVQRLREQGVTDAELRRAITRAEAEHAFRSETAEGRARLLGHAETVWRLAEELSYIDRVRSVTSEQVRLAARRYLDPERYGRLAFVPPAR